MLLLGLLFLASMFDLPTGTWRDEAYTLVIRTRDITLNNVTGAYQVTATKMGDYHVTWSVREGELKLGDFFIRPGSEVRLSLTYREGLRLVVFDEEVSPVLTRDFPDPPPNSPR